MCAIIAREKQLHIRGLSGKSTDRPRDVRSYVRNVRVVKVLMSKDDMTIYAFGTTSANNKMSLLKIETSRLEHDDALEMVAVLPGLSYGDEFTARLSAGTPDNYVLISTLLGDIFKVRLVD